MKWSFVRKIQIGFFLQHCYSPGDPEHLFSYWQAKTISASTLCVGAGVATKYESETQDPVDSNGEIVCKKRLLMH